MQHVTATHPDHPAPQALPLWVVRSAAVAGVVAMLALSVPVLWAAVSAGLGLLALALMGAGGIVLLQAMPWAMQRLENRLLRMRKREASAHPIEQLENDVLRRAERLAAFRAALAVVGGQIESIRQMLAERRHVDPDHVMEPQERALQRLIDFYAANLGRLDRAQLALADFRSTVDRKRTEWTLAVAIGETHQLLNPEAADILIEDLLSDEALRTVQDRFNTVFAELDIQMVSGALPAGRPLATGYPERQTRKQLPAVDRQRSAP